MVSLLIFAASAKLLDPLLTFSREPSFDPHQETVEIGVLRTGPTSEFWLKRTVVQQKAKAVSWTDTVRCPAARMTLKEVRKLPMPQVSVAGLENDDIIITGDGTLYRLTGYAEYPGKGADDFEIRSNNDTPLALWVDTSLRTLQPCWSKEPPKVR